MAYDVTLLGRMQELARQWESAGDRRSVFLKCYSMMTANMLKAIDRGHFDDSAWVQGLLEHFAGYYFNALQAYEIANPGIPLPWRIAFDAATEHQGRAIQDLLLGVNAHINYDLVMAVYDRLRPEWSELDEAGRQRRRSDHCRVNDIIAQTIDAVQDSVLEPLEPELEIVDRLFGRLDEWATTTMIARWRDRVWNEAVRRLELEDDLRLEAQQREIETEACTRARVILGRDMRDSLDLLM
jgi:hypothetical protein